MFKTTTTTQIKHQLLQIISSARVNNYRKKKKKKIDDYTHLYVNSTNVSSSKKLYLMLFHVTW